MLYSHFKRTAFIHVHYLRSTISQRLLCCDTVIQLSSLKKKKNHRIVSAFPYWICLLMVRAFGTIGLLQIVFSCYPIKVILYHWFLKKFQRIISHRVFFEILIYRSIQTQYYQSKVWEDSRGISSRYTYSKEKFLKINSLITANSYPLVSGLPLEFFRTWNPSDHCS